MKKQLLYIFCTFAWLCVFCTSAFAEDCPNGTQKAFDAKTNQEFCFEFENTPSVVVVAENKEELNIRKNLSSSGAEINLGLGYGMVGAFDLRIAAEYQFELQNLDGVTFGLNTDFSIRFPYPTSLDWSIGPMLHVHGNIFRVGFGFGLGIFSAFDPDEVYDYEDEYDNDDQLFSKALFQLKPELRLDWFLSEHVLIGLNTDMCLIFYKGREYNYHDDNYEHVKKVMPWFSITFHVGYKF